MTLPTAAGARAGAGGWEYGALWVSRRLCADDREGCPSPELQVGQDPAALPVMIQMQESKLPKAL